jgi:hypothetical protein
MMDETCLDEANAWRRNQERIDVLCDRFEEAWRGGGRPCLADFVGEAGAPVLRNGNAMLLQQLIAIDLWYRWRAPSRSETSSPEIQGATPREDARWGDNPLPDCPLLDDYVRCFPELGSLEDVPDDFPTTVNRGSPDSIRGCSFLPTAAWSTATTGKGRCWCGTRLRGVSY